MKEKIVNKDSFINKLKNFFYVDWSSFFVFIKMLLNNSLSLDFKKNKKKSIISILTKVLIFAITAAISFLFFYLCDMMAIFSLISITPSSVPSIIIMIILFFSFVSTLFRVMNDLFFSSDNKVLLTLPSNGNTLFISRLFVSFITAYLKALKLEIPFLIGYFISNRYPIYMYFVIFLIFIVIELFFTLLSSLIAVPLYFVKKFLITYPLVKNILLILSIGTIITLASLLISIIPEKIDIFSNWSTYFYKVQDGLTYYTVNMSFLYNISSVMLGIYNGYKFSYFSGVAIYGLYTLIVLIGSNIILFLLSLALANPFYLRLASGNDELMEKHRNKNKNSKELKPGLSQFKKESLLFIKDNYVTPGYLTVFISLPLIMALIGKIFLAMDLNKRGISLSIVAILLITLLISLSANASIAKLFSIEGGAFNVGRTYPLNDNKKITSKIIIPMVIGIISLIITFIIIALLRTSLLLEMLLLGGGVILIYVSHLLYSAGLDFSSPKNIFGDISFLSNNEGRSTIYGFSLSLIITIIFYYSSYDNFYWINNDAKTSACFKVLLIGILLLAFSIYNYNKRIKYIYQKGETL